MFRELQVAASRALLRRAARLAAALRAARRRRAADRAAHAGPVQRDVLRACAARALPRLSARRGQRPDGARRPRLDEDDRRPAARARDRPPPGRRLLRSARAARRLGARRRRARRVRAPRQRAARQCARLRRARVGRAARLPAGAVPRRCSASRCELPSVATWWLGEPAALDDASELLERLIVKPLERSPQRARPVFVADLSLDERQALRARIAARPHRYVAQEWVHVSQAPVFERGPPRGPGGAHGRPARVRGGDARRLACDAGRPDARRGDGDSRVIAMQRGGRSKDTWVLSEAPVNSAFSLLSSSVGAGELVGVERTTRVAHRREPLWFGRYGERCDASVRVLRVALGQRARRVARRAPTASAPALALALHLGLIDSTDDSGGPAAPRRHASGAQRSPSGCASSRASPSTCATACRPTTGAPSTA